MILILCMCIITYVLPCVECALIGKIVGGQYPKITDFPHAAHLSIRCELKGNGELSSWVCGSSILNQKLLLTAAHCLEECSSNSWISASVGHVNTKKGRRTSVTNYVIHEEYYDDTTDNDIGLVMVKTPLKFNSKVNRVVLLKKPPYDELAYVAGWGIIDEEDNTMDPNMKFVEQHIWKKKDCVDLLQSIPRGTFCASSNNNNDYAAGGDSGNGLIVRGYIQVGIVSYKRPDTSQSVVVYTDVGFFYKWIQKNAKRLWCETN